MSDADLLEEYAGIQIRPGLNPEVDGSVPVSPDAALLEEYMDLPMPDGRGGFYNAAPAGQQRDAGNDFYNPLEQAQDIGLGVAVGGARQLRHLIDPLRSTPGGDNPGDVANEAGVPNINMRQPTNDPRFSGQGNALLNRQLPPGGMTDQIQAEADNTANDVRPFDETFGKAGNPTRGGDRGSRRLEAFEKGAADLRTDEFKDRQQVLGQSIAEADEGLPKFWAGLSEITTTPSLWMPMLAEVAGALGTAAVVGGGVAGPAGIIGASSMDMGGSEADRVLGEVLAMDDAFFNASERYVYLANLPGMTDELAKERLGNELSESTRWKASAVSAFLNAMPWSSRMEMLLGGAASSVGKSSGAVTSALKTGLGEAGQEVAENEAGNIIGNLEKQKLDPNQRALEGWGDSGVDAVMGFGAGTAIDAGNTIANPGRFGDNEADQGDLDVAAMNENLRRANDIDPDAKVDEELDTIAKSDEELADMAKADADAKADNKEIIDELRDAPIDYAAQNQTTTREEETALMEAQMLREQDDYIYDDESESTDFINDVAKQAGVIDTNSATAESQAIPSEPTSNGDVNEEVNRRNSSAGNSEQGNAGINPDIRQQEVTTPARSERQPIDARSNETGNVTETRVENEAQVKTPERRKTRTLDVKKRKQIKSYLKRVSENTKGRVQVFDNFEDSTLDEDLKQNLRERQKQGRVSPAFFDADTDKIYLFESLVKSRADVRGLVAHEVVHAGLMDMFGSEDSVKHAMLTLFNSHPDMDAVLHRIARESDFDPSLYDKVDEQGKVIEQIMPSVFIEEALAHMRESEQSQPQLVQFFKKIIQMLKELGYKLRPRKDESAEQALLRVVKQAEKRFYSGQGRSPTLRGSMGGLPRERWLRVRYSLRPTDDQIEFYSVLHEAAVAMKRKSGTPAQILAALKKHPGVKNEEIQWTGLDNWLDMQNGTVTRDQVADYLFANGVQIETVIDQSDGQESNSSGLDFDWSEETQEGREHWDWRVDDYMNDYDNGDPDDSIMDMDAANLEYYEEHPDELMAKFMDDTTRNPKIALALDYLRRQIRVSQSRDESNQMELFEQSLVEQALDDIDMNFTGWDVERLSEFADALESDDIESQMTILDVEINYDQFRDDYEEKVEERAEAEYMDNPIIEVSDSYTGYSFVGNDDTGWTLHYPDWGGTHHMEGIHNQDDAQNYAEQEARERIEEYAESNDETQYHEYLEDGDFTTYEEVRLTLPDIDPVYDHAHFNDENVVSFMRTTDRKVNISGVAESGFARPAVYVRPYFIEELQSDWHQKGAAEGYIDASALSRREKFERAQNTLVARVARMSRYYHAQLMNPDNIKVTAEATDIALARRELNVVSGEDSTIRRSPRAKIMMFRDLEATAKRVFTGDMFARFQASLDKVIQTDAKIDVQKGQLGQVPDVPFKDSAWIELSAKKAIGLAMAAGHTHVAWPNSTIVVKRWNDKAEKLYQLVYDKKLPSVMKKLAGNTPFRTEDNQWIVELNPAKLEGYRTKGMPKFATRRSGVGLNNIATVTRQNFERSEWRGVLDEAKRMFAEKYEVAPRVQGYVKEQGGRVDDSTDFYSALKSIPGRTMAKMTEFEGNFIKPLEALIKQHKIKADEIGLYAYAMHARERNAQLRADYDLPDDASPSGMTDEEAVLTIEYFERRGLTPAMTEAMRLVQEMRAQMLKHATDSGLMHEFIADEYNERYENYVPLKGFSVTRDSHGEIVDPPAPRKPIFTQGHSITGKEFRRALGRQSKAFDPFSTLVSDSMEMIVRSETNEAMQHFLRFAQANQMPEQWKIFTAARPDVKRRFVRRKDPLTGDWLERPEMTNMTDMEMASEYVGVKYRGNQYYVKVADKRLENMLKNDPQDKLNLLLIPFRKVNRALAYVYTSLSPAFAVANFTRDLPTAYLKIKAEQTRDDGQIQGKDIGAAVMVDTLPAMRSMFRMLTGKPPRPGNAMDAAAHTMQDNGGLVGYYAVKNPEQFADEMEKFVKHNAQNAAQRGFRSGWRGVRDAIDIVNRMIENGVRLSAYHHATQGPTGVSAKQGATFARELTVDFNARGASANNIGALYLFFNPAIQGTRQFNRVMLNLDGDGSPKWKNLNAAQKIMLGTVAFAGGWAAMMREVMGEDDDGEDYWDKIPAYHKERSFIIPKWWSDTPGAYLAIPMPYGYSAVYAIGNAIEQALRGPAGSAAKAGSYMFSAMLGSFSPVAVETTSNEVEAKLLKTLSPEVASPFLELLMNQNYFGSTIFNEQTQFGTQYADSYEGNSRLNTGQLYKNIASFLNENTGGTSMMPGDYLWSIDVHPETIRYWWKYATGGLGTLLVDQVAAPVWEGMAKGTPYNWENVPVFAGWTSSVKGYEDINNFYKRSNTVAAVAENKLDALSRGDTKEVAKLERQYGDIDTMLALAKVYRKQMSNLRKERNRLKQVDGIAGDDLHQLTKDLDDEIGLLADLFNKEYNEIMKAR